MSTKVECPYCKDCTEINFDVSIDDGDEFKSQCNRCGEIFKVTTEYTPTYSASKYCEVREENQEYDSQPASAWYKRLLLVNQNRADHHLCQCELTKENAYATRSTS